MLLKASRPMWSRMASRLRAASWGRDFYAEIIEPIAMGLTLASSAGGDGAPALQPSRGALWCRRPHRIEIRSLRPSSQMRRRFLRSFGASRQMRMRFLTCFARGPPGEVDLRRAAGGAAQLAAAAPSPRS